jgi:protein O-mannosyl-transferase
VPLVGWGDWRALGSLALVVGLLALAGWMWRKSRVTAFSILYFFITLSIVSNLAFPVGTFMNERFIYMPSVGFCLLIAYLLVQKLPEWLSAKTGQMVAYGVLGVMGLGFAVRTVTRVPAWENSATLEAASIQVSYNSARSNQYYAYSLYEKALVEKDPVKQKALYDEAWPYVNKAIEIYPAYYDAHTCRDGIAAAYFQQDGDIGKLLPYFENTLRTKPTDFVDQYLDYLSKRGQHVPELTDFFHRVGHGYFWTEKHDPARAKKYLEMGLRLAPADARLAADLAGVK